jgi:hypothetical protein
MLLFRSGSLLPSAAPFLSAKRCDLVMVASWLVLLAGVIALPYATQSPTLGDDLIRFTIRLALVYYVLAASLMLRLPAGDWRASAGRGRLARWCWTLAWAAYLVHLGMAFHHYHSWSHAAAVEHTRQVSGVGAGIYASHLFTLVWTMDVLFWWLQPARYATRSPWIDRMLHGFMAFIIFNGTIVYENGPIRWFGILMFSVLALLWAYRFLSRPVLAVDRG